MLMKKILIICLLSSLPIVLLAKHKGGNIIHCNVTYTEFEKLANKAPKGVGRDFRTGKERYLYSLEGADIYLISGADTLDRVKSDFEGLAIFKKVANGEYVISASKEGFESVSSKVVIKDNNGKALLTFGAKTE